MPELSRPLIAILGVVISVAVLFIAVAGFLPFFQQSVSSTTQQASFSATASPAQSSNKVIFTVNVQKLVGSGNYQISQSDVTVYYPNGDSATGGSTSVAMSPTLVSFSSGTTAQGFVLEVDTTGYTATGTWVIVITIDDSDGNPVQTISLEVEVA